MDIQNQDQEELKKKITSIKTEQKLGLGVKIVIGIVIVGSIAAGIVAAVVMAK